MCACFQCIHNLFKVQPKKYKYATASQNPVHPVLESRLIVSTIYPASHKLSKYSNEDAAQPHEDICCLTNLSTHRRLCSQSHTSTCIVFKNSTSAGCGTDYIALHKILYGWLSGQMLLRPATESRHSWCGRVLISATVCRTHPLIWIYFRLEALKGFKPGRHWCINRQIFTGADVRRNAFA